MTEEQVANEKQTSSDSQAEQRYRAIEQAAYLKAERRGFEPGHEVEDWLNAEREVDQGEYSAD